jgi:hypothetical protein
LGISFLGSKNNCSPPPSAFNVVKSAEFNNGMGGRYGMFGVREFSVQ